MPGIKISGITNEEDARWAAILGVEFVSVSLMEGDHRKTSDEMASRITGMLPSYTEVILEADSPDSVSERRIGKISPAYISTPLEPEDGSADTIPGILSLRKLERIEDSPEVKLIEVKIEKDLSGEDIAGIALKFPDTPLIIEGDFELPVIKNICAGYQPRAWSVRDIISRSPRRIDYPLMKEYIREISLW